MQVAQTEFVMPFVIKSVANGMVLDVKESKTCSGAEVILWPYNGGQNQLWEYKNKMIYSELSGLALDIAGSKHGGSVITYSPNGGNNQKWFFDGDDTIRSGTGMVLEIEASNFQAGTRIVGYTKHGGLNQKFRMVDETESVMPFVIKSVANGMVLDVKHSKTCPGAQVILWPYHGGQNQLWEYKNKMIYSKLSGLVLDIAGSKHGGSVTTNSPHGGNNQKWYFDDDDTIRSGTGMVLEIKGSKFKPGTKILGYKKDGGVNQKFRMETCH